MFTDDFCKYANPFYGNGETDRFFKDGLASKWFYIKALCGNTTPHATLPFGKMSVGAYSGGYPSGYGTHYPNSCGGIKKLSDKLTVRGFSHLHQSGTGAMRYYYNYAVTTPFYGNIERAQEYRQAEGESAVPGYYSVNLGGVFCELTVDGGIALHRYTFERDGGRVAVDFSNDGLAKIIGPKHSGAVASPELKIKSNTTVLFSGIFSGVKLYFCVKTDTPPVKTLAFSESQEFECVNDIAFAAPFGIVFDISGRAITLRVGFSTVSYDAAERAVCSSVASFDSARSTAYKIWGEHLCKFKIDTDSEELKYKFYSNLYHSLIKPCDLSGEEVLGIKGDLVGDLATLWDQYKTVLPLIYLSYPEMSQKIVKCILNISRTLGKIPCSLGITDIFPCEEQAKMLGILTLLDAFNMGVQGISLEDIEECTERELARDDFKTFIENGTFERYTHILDAADACAYLAKITKNAELKNRLLSLAANWINAYGKDGLMSESSPYYEGDRFTYSFRPQHDMQKRIELAGGKERFIKLLDDFFGFGKESIEPIRKQDAFADISKTAYHRFEGFNNECDMDAPYAYIFADRHDRLAEILHECTSRSFGSGRAGLPGNNDSGGLSSAFVFNSLGIFPLSGSGDFLIGAPAVDGAQITLSSGNTLKIKVNRERRGAIFSDKVEFNGKPKDGYRISAHELMGGGTLEFFMK